MNKTLACCYLTHNHPDVMDEVLEQIVPTYGARGIDIYIYDSSDGNETELIVNKYIERNQCNLYYVDARFTEGGDDKLYKIIQGIGLPKHYDYIWPSKDRCFFTGETLDKIVEEIDKDYDIVFALNENDRWEAVVPKVKDVYTNPVEFFSHYGQLTTNWECLIRKTETMVDPVDWEDFSRRYNLGKDNNFNQGVSVFARLAELENCKIRVIHINPIDKKYSALSHSGWGNMVLELWIESWVMAINSLPSIYDPYKLAVIQSETFIPILFGSIDIFLYRIEEGIITREKFEKYRPLWSLVSDIPLEYVDMMFDDRLQDLVQAIMADFKNAFATHDYIKAQRIFTNNTWIEQAYGKDDYGILALSFNYFLNEMREHGATRLFMGINTPEEIIERYRSLTNN